MKQAKLTNVMFEEKVNLLVFGSMTYISQIFIILYIMNVYTTVKDKTFSPEAALWTGSSNYSNRYVLLTTASVIPAVVI